MRFLHVADIHLDTGFAGRSAAVRARLREASRIAFRNAVDVAIREDVHALLIAGDLFDGDRLSFQTERFLLEQTERLGDHGITVVYATGNHDPGASDVGPRRIQWPACVRIAPDATPRRILVHDHGGQPVGYVTAIGHATGHVGEDLSRLLPMPSRDLPEVALLHTQVHSSLGSDDHHPYAPSELTYLRHAGYDYWALGHVHIRQELSDDPPIWYSGSLQGKSHGDQGVRGGLLVDLSDRTTPAIAFRPLGPVRWETVDVARLESLSTLDELERHLLSAWRGARDDDPGTSATEWMVRFVLTGPCPLWSELREAEDREMLGRELASVLGALDVTVVADDVHPVISVEEHRVRTDVLGEALRLCEAIQRGTATLEHLDPGALAGVSSADPTALHGYVRRLLTDADGEIAAKLLEDGTS
jgi:DNA repair exonuclease SbcCD nuclease subunit